MGNDFLMTWTAPDTHRRDEPGAGPERPTLDAWLDYHRETLLQKCAGLDGDQLALRSVEPSTLSLLGLVRHMTEVERSWFRRRFAGEPAPAEYYSDDNPDGDFDDAAGPGAEADFAAFAEEIERCRRVAAGCSLDDTFVHERTGGTLDLRYVYVHLIEEYARHNGHADLLRQRVDGAVGD